MAMLLAQRPGIARPARLAAFAASCAGSPRAPWRLRAAARAEAARAVDGATSTTSSAGACCASALRAAARQQPAPAHGRRRAAQYQRGAVQALRVRGQLARHVGAGEHGGLGAQFLGQLEHGQDAVARGRRQARSARRFHVRRIPAHVELAGQPRGAAHGLAGALVRADAGQDAPRCSSRGPPSTGARAPPWTARCASRARRLPRARRCGAARSRAARSGCPCERSSARRGRPAAAGRPCLPPAARSARRA